MSTGDKLPLAPLHACERALERYGITISVGELRVVEDKIRAGDGMLMRRDQNGDEVRVIRLLGQLATVVCMPNGTIKTFLPPDAPLKQKGWRWAS